MEEERIMDSADDAGPRLIEKNESRGSFDIKEMVSKELPPLPANSCIYRVPKRLRRVNEEAYTPQMVSIGPLHHGKENFLAMEEVKLRYLNKLLDRTNMILDDCIEEIKKLEADARDCYAENIKLTSDEFVKMMLVDGSFIIEAMLILTGTYASEDTKNHTYFKRWTVVDMRPDMILLENQLPFFILQTIFNLAFPAGKCWNHSLLEISLSFFGDIMMAEKCPKTTLTLEVKHFLDLLRLCHLPSSLRPSPYEFDKFYVSIPKAVELCEAGVVFMKGSLERLLDIHYTPGVLKIPPLVIQQRSEILLRNLMALEQCHYQYDSYITDYIYLMDNLIDTDKDVELLVQNGIIMTFYGDNSRLANLFNNLVIETTLATDNYYYYGCAKEIKEFCEVPWHKWKATLKRDYLSTPWKVSSTIAAIVLILLTFIQTICSIIGK
ncbi:putative UPF0481 protein At3g02645 [Malania oleifera]|uniref:putative UPF0481 protein At3g02645 n=1 Tax=Malania oleifera TaxID=397392 RepID=UPI0025AE57F8|nr:putative UPF0481 protein At3g02645 [Malania oleifera]